MIKQVQNSSENHVNYRWKFNILAFIFLIATSCTTAPEDTVRSYLDLTFLDNNGKKAYQLLSSDDKKYQSEKEFNSEIRRKNIFNEKILKKYKDQFSYEILDTKFLNEDTVVVKVALSKPNTHNILHEMVAYAMAASFSKISTKEKNYIMKEQFGKIMTSNELEVEKEETEFTLVKEEGEYKIYLNLGQPYKQEILNEKLNKLESKAEEQKRVIDYEGALKTYKTMLSLQKDEAIQAEIDEIKKIRKNTVHPGEKLKIGNLIVKPKKVEVRKVVITKKKWLGENPDVTSDDAYFVLTLNITNNCEGEVFEFYNESRYKKEHTVFDNYGNVMNEFDLDFYTETVEGYKHKKLPAGETIEVRAVCEAPLSRKAENFLWRIKLYTDNKKTEDYVYVAFKRKEIKY